MGSVKEWFALDAKYSWSLLWGIKRNFQNCSVKYNAPLNVQNPSQIVLTFNSSQESLGAFLQTLVCGLLSSPWLQLIRSWLYLPEFSTFTQKWSRCITFVPYGEAAGVMGENEGFCFICTADCLKEFCSCSGGW